MANSRLFRNENALLFLRSRVLFPQFNHKSEKEENADLSPLPVSKSTPGSLSSVKQDSLESLTGEECSSHVSFELEGKRRHLTLCESKFASHSCIEISQCRVSESAVEAGDSNAESLQNSLMCYDSKPANFSSNNLKKDEDCSVLHSSLATGVHGRAFNLLVLAAAQEIENDARPHPQADVPNSNSHLDGGIWSSPILKRRVIRRAKSAFHRQVTAATKSNLTKATAKPLSEGDRENLRRAATKSKFRVPHVKQRKLEDIHFKSKDAMIKSSVPADEDLERKCPDVKRQTNAASLSITKCELLDVGDSLHSEAENTEMVMCKSPNTFDGEGSEVLLTRGEISRNFIDDKKLQISCSRHFDASSTEHSNGADGTKLGTDTKPELDTSRLENYYSTLRACKDESKGYLGTKADSTSSAGRDKETGEPKQGNLAVRLKILPIRLPTMGLPPLQEVPKTKDSELTTASMMITRKRSALLTQEQACASIFTPSSCLQSAEMRIADNKGEDTNPVIRTKRGRSQVLPTKFSDSIFHQWKPMRKKSRVLNT
ncbi:hypothetical protein KP509_16G053900 [Ceratopteris richardii]|nr:hypothetical protein KP509_16G053900 [Ceratopteris richardii]